MQQIIFHCDDEEKASKLFNSVRNLLIDMDEAEEAIAIEILANGSAVNLFKKENKGTQKNMKAFIQKNLQLSLCQNSLNARDLLKDDMLDEARIVPSGVGELTRKQNKGWAYIKL